MDEELKRFLRNRGVPERAIVRMEEDKVDRFVIQTASDDTLNTYFPSAGDRLAVQAFCSSKPPNVVSKKSEKRSKILATLRKKLLLKQGNIESEESEREDMHKSTRHSSLSGNTNALKDKRKIEIGWLHYEGAGYKQVRKKKGGGTRKVNVSKDANATDILRVAKALFFEQGKSTFGAMDDFTFDLTDFCESSLCNSFSTETIWEMYNRTGFPILRFYMATQYKAHPAAGCSKTDEPPPLKIPDLGKNLRKESENVDYTEDESLLDIETTGSNIISLDSKLEESESEVFFNFRLTPPTDLIITETGAASSSIIQDIQNPTSSEVYEININSFQDTAPVSTLGSQSTMTSHISADLMVLPSSNQSTMTPLLSNDLVLPDMQTITTESVEMIIHRGAGCFKELLGYFKDPGILSKHLTIIRVLQNGERETAEDTGGVLRDLLSDFWSEFYEKCTLGRTVKVPSLRHDFGSEEWRSSARILKYGWENAGYWPVEISKSFICQILQNGSTEVLSSELLMSDFADFISKPDQEIFEKALMDVSSVETDDLLDLLEAYDCKISVNDKNIRSTFIEIAHKELIQTPMYVIDCWQDILHNTQINIEKLNEIYSALVPNNKSVLKLLEFPESPLMMETTKHLKRYVKELDGNKLRRFLRFCTGADLITVPKISVTFTDVKGLARRPVSHTCGCVLEIPQSYENFMEFRSEFDGILESNVWVMDIV